ncbi:hypothetical protein ACX7S9_002504 [Morganella morganii]|uniref:hypothetical protein n=1 Tax=Morganella morganii TaxID=582 RepID=UPI0006657B9B|nr:hypothetical protein [Morganella morganii]SSN08160.1 Uncharacterised protein [Klebsiella pneumoniae]EJD6111621.1 hypothetical protein [Morganella morganii]EJG2206114.1 hypothetical protein [Morganella morganii]EKU4015223.1 hypothetical protein [Morganella morganii]ELA7701690.1 hypothetical protein [Morganella morganii]
MNITTEKELAQALKNNEDSITIEGDLARKTVRIKATGSIAWIIAIGAIGVAVAAVLATAGTGGVATPISGAVGFSAAGAAVGVLGTSATYSAIAIAVAAGGIGVLNKLRRYKIVDKSNDIVVLRRK